MDTICTQSGAVREDLHHILAKFAGVAEHGGIQIIVYPTKRDRY